MEEKSLPSLLSLYQITCSEISKYESAKVNIPFLASAFLGTVLGFVISDSATNGWKKTIILMGLVMITVVVYHIFSFASRMSSILQGYAAYLEEEINRETGDTHAKIYSQYIDAFIIPSKFHTNLLSFVCLIPLVGVIGGVSFISAYLSAADVYQMAVITLCLLFYIPVMGVYIWDCTKNDEKRAAAKVIPPIVKSE